MYFRKSASCLMGVLLCSSVVFGSDSGSDSGSDNDDDIVGGVDHPSTVVSPPGDKGVNSEDPSATVVFRSDFGSDDEGVRLEDLVTTQDQAYNFAVSDAEVRNGDWEIHHGSGYPNPYSCSSLQEKVSSAEQAIELLRGELKTVRESIPTDGTKRLVAAESLREELKYSRMIDGFLQNALSLTPGQMVWQIMRSPSYTVPKFFVSSGWAWLTKCR